MIEIFPNTSRYHHIETTKLITVDNQEIIYLRRRFLPSVENGSLLVEHEVTQGERLDQITARYLGDPEQFWQLCDANRVMHPAEMTAEIGRRIQVLMPVS